MHRDLKLENLLLASPQDITKVKIADFGLAKKAAESQMETICGTPQYVAPEVIQVTHHHDRPAIPLTRTNLPAWMPHPISASRPRNCAPGTCHPH